jgi:ribonuclease HII
MVKERKLLEDWPEYDYVAGLDECGRGCGAGPVVTATVIMPRGFKSPLIRDSKKLSEKQRKEAYELIMVNAISISCHAGSIKDINELGINKATFKTMHKCIDELSIKPEYLLVDGTVWEDYTGTTADNSNLTLGPKGDDTYTCIAAAAIIAKVRRDEYMCKLHLLHPEYNWCNNKGYLTPDHIIALKKYGKNKYHRDQYVKNFVKKLDK